MAIPAPPTRSRWRWPVVALAVLGPFLTDWPPGARVGMVVAVVGLFWFRLPSRKATVRQVEPPNSHFNIVGVQHEEIRTRWDDLDPETLHEANREVIAVLLTKARSLGPDYLYPSEVELLDRMARARRPPEAA